MMLTDEELIAAAHDTDVVMHPIAAYRAVALAQHNKTCESLAKVFEDFSSNHANKNTFYHTPTICRSLKHDAA